jgi:hypothetical protein
VKDIPSGFKAFLLASLLGFFFFSLESEGQKEIPVMHSGGMHVAEGYPSGR